MAEKQDGFFNNASKFFKRLRNQDLIRVGDNKITTLNQPIDKDEQKRRSTFATFRQYLQQKNWSTRHIELFNEYRKMDDSYPIINAALRLYTQEVCGVLDTTKVQLLSGEIKTLRELVEEKYTNFWAWGYDPEQKRIVPVKCDKAISKGFKEVVEIKLDDGTNLEFTPDHKFLLTSGKWKEAKDLVEGDSLQSIYEKLDAKGYLELSDGQVCKNNKKKLKWKKAHSIVANEVDFLKLQKENLQKNKYESKRDNIPVCHHSSFNKLNNDPNRLEWLLWEDHRKIHEDRYDKCLRWENLSEEDKAKRIEQNRITAKKLWSNPEKAAAKAKNHSKKMIEYFSSLTPEERKTKHVTPFNENHNWWGRNTCGKNNPNADITKKHFEDYTIEELDELTKWYCSKELFRTDQNCSRKVIGKYLQVKNTDFRFLGYATAASILKKGLIKSEITTTKDFNNYVSNFNIKGFNLKSFGFYLKRNGYKNGVNQFVNESKTNHKVVSVTYKKEIKEVGDIVNAGNVHNFAIKCNEGMVITHNCLTGDTQILTPMGIKSILELIDMGKGKDSFYVTTVDLANNKTQWGYAKGIKYNGKKEVFEVVIEKNIDAETALIDTVEIAKFKCTDNHKIMVSDHSFKPLNELKAGDEIFSYYKWIDPTCKCKKDKFQTSKIISITLIGEEDVYDLINVEPFSHFSIQLTNSLFVQVHNCTKNEDGNIIKIHSDDKEIQKSLEELFFDKLKINSKGNLLVKEFLKFGNLYCFLNIRKGEGVIDLIHLPPEAIRIELQANAEHLDDFKYSWFGQSGGGMRFEPFEVVHFRNIEDIEMEPYGTSILRSIVDTWRRIILMREALIIYRITRAPQRYLFKIDTSGMDSDAAMLHAENIKKDMYKKPLVNPFTGEIDFKYNPLPIAGYTPVPLLSGEIKTIKELAEDYDKGVENYVYSIQDKTHQIVAGKVKWCGKNYTANKLIRVWLDNDSYIDSAPEHPFMRRDGSRVRADELKEGDSLMPLNRLEANIRTSKSVYEQIYNPATGKFEFTHRLVAKEIPKKNSNFNTVHHCSFNRFNNNPDQLEWVDFKEHKKMHSQMNKNRESWKPMYESMKNPLLRAKQKQNAKIGQLKEEPVYLNHKVKRIEILENVSEDVFCMTVVGLNDENDRHNFGVGGLSKNSIKTHNILIFNSIEENFYQPTFSGDVGGVEVLDGASNLNDVEDYNIIKDDLFAGLLIPKSYLCLHPETKIKCLDGKDYTIFELNEKYKNGEEISVYASDKNGDIKPGNVSWVGETRKTKTTYVITLDNDEKVECSEDHEWLLRDGSYKKAKDLKAYDSLMPLYTRIGKKGYEDVHHNGKNKWQKTHQMVVLDKAPNFYKQDGNGKFICHHKDSNKRNNYLNNLQKVTQEEHNELHQWSIPFLHSEESRRKAKETVQTPEYRLKVSKRIKELFLTEPERRLFYAELAKIRNAKNLLNEGYLEKINKKELSYIGNKNSNFKNKIDKESLIEILEKNKPNTLLQLNKLIKNFSKEKGKKYKISPYKFESLALILNLSKEEFCKKYNFTSFKFSSKKIKNIDEEKLLELVKKGINLNKISQILNVTCNQINNYYLNKYDKSFAEYQETELNNIYFNSTYNHKVKSIEIKTYDEEIQLYDLTVDNYHNFALSAGVFVSNSFEEDLCLKGDTEILTNTGKITIKELAETWEEGKKTFVLSCNKYGFITPGKILKVWETKKTKEFYQITINDTINIFTTDNHPFLINESLIYKRADELQVGDKLKSMYERDFCVTDTKLIINEFEESVYDLEVEEYHNFALSSGIFVHNSNKAALAQEDIRFGGAIKQYQGNFIEGLLHIAVVHLYTSGFSTQDISNFTIEMNTSSKLLLKLENETLQQKVDLAKSVLDTSNGELTLMSYTQVLRDIMKFTDEEIKLTIENQFLEKKLNWRLSKLKEDGFYVEPQETKDEEKKERLGDTDIFSNIQFEHAKKDPDIVKQILNEKVVKEIAGLYKSAPKKPSKKMIKTLIDLNPLKTEINNVQRDLKMNKVKKLL